MGTPNVLIRWLRIEIGIMEAELYGVDMESEKYRLQRPHLEADIEAGFKVVCPCKSSPLYTGDFVPWVR
jgi:hypothetical protein